MGINPWYTGQLSPIWTFQLIPDSGVFNVSGLIPSDFTTVFRNTDVVTLDDIPGTGTFSNIVASSGTGLNTIPASVQYQVSSADVATPGNYHVFVKVTTGNGLAVFDFGTWQVETL